MATKKEKQKAMLVSAAATNEPYTSKHTGEEIDSAVDKALAMDPYSKDETDGMLEKKADVSDLSDYVQTESLPEVFNDYGIENEQEVPILKQTIGYESRNLFDFDAWYSSITRTIGGTLSKIDNGCTLKTTGADQSYTEPFVYNSSSVYKIPVFPNTTYILSYIATGDYDTAVFFNGISSNEHKERTFVTSSDTTFITFRLVAKASSSVTISNIQLQLANAQTDDTYTPYTPTVNDRLLALENLDAPVIAKKYKLNNAISFEANKLGQRVFQELIPVSVDGYTPVCSCLSYVINSVMYNPITFLSKDDGRKVYVNAYAATNEHYTDTDQMEVIVTFISNDYYQGIATVSSDEPTLEGPSFETEQRYLQEEPSYE